MNYMNVNYAELAATAVRPEQYPAAGLPEFAFVGKSNTGKSSLLNTMAGRKALARTSGSPGKTRTINFFNINNMCMFVDLPGYGYSRASTREMGKWGKMIDRYLLNRKQLMAIFLLLDIRHDLTVLDRQMLNWLLYYSFDVIIIASKADKLKRSVIHHRIKYFREATGFKDIMAFSSKTGDGRQELWNAVLNKLGIISDYKMNIT